MAPVEDVARSKMGHDSTHDYAANILEEISINKVLPTSLSPYTLAYAQTG
jgi:hypothetical protein